jgi:Flp pilus assembly protein TadG
MDSFGTPPKPRFHEDLTPINDLRPSITILVSDSMKMFCCSLPRKTFKDFCISRAGNIAVTFALSLVPIITALGCAVDYSQANSAYTKLQTCADSAVVAAVSKQGMTQTASSAQASMVSWFNTVCPNSASNMSRVTVSNVSATATDTNGVRVAALTFTASRANDFLRAVGLPTTSIKGSAKAGSAQPTYIDIYALLDDSPSMGLASTAADQAKLISLTPDSCQFGCHVSGASSDNYTIAKANNVEMRIDVLRNSWINLIKQAQNVSGVNVFRFATYTFNNSLILNQNLTGSYATALASANSIDLMTVDSSGPGSSYADSALQSMVPNIPNSGNGSSSANSIKYLIFVTDGVQDLYNCSYLWCHQTKTLTSSSCTALKNKGINVAVIYTTYLPMADNQYVQLVQPLASNIAPALQSCASSGLYFAATDATEISNAFSSIFTNVLSNARLTN